MERAGSFGQEEGLFEASQKAEQKDQEAELTWSTPEASILQKSLSSAIRTIRPVTIVDLKSGWQVDKGNLDYEDRFVKWSTVALATLVMFVCATLTIWQQRATDIVADMSNNKVEQQAAAYDDLIGLISAIPDNAPDLANPSSPMSLAFRQKLREIESIENSMWLDQLSYSEIDMKYPLNSFPSIEELYGRFAEGVISAGSAEAGGGTDSKILVAVNQSEQSAGPIACDSASLEDNIAEQYKGLTTEGRTDLEYYLSSIGYSSGLIAKVRCDTGLEPIRAAILGRISRQGPYDVEIMRYKLSVLSLWLLPAFYAMLGSFVYHLRAFLNSARPNPNFSTIMLRVGLSGFAGIAIGWFWSPSNGTILGVPDITITPLTIAFLVGFGLMLLYRSWIAW